MFLKEHVNRLCGGWGKRKGGRIIIKDSVLFIRVYMLSEDLKIIENSNENLVITNSVKLAMEKCKIRKAISRIFYKQNN